MNEEEKKAIEYSKNCLMKITLGIDCEFDVNILDTLLNTIKKLQKENEYLQYKLRERISVEAHEQVKQNYIAKNIIKDKIEELEKEIVEK